METIGRSVRASIDFNGPLNALSASPNNKLIAVGGRDVLKIVALESTGFSEKRNLRAGKSNLNFSTNDIRWHPHYESLLATAATNGAVVIWNLQREGFKHVQERVLNGHRRAVNRICWHTSDWNLLASGSQDGTIKLWDKRGRVHSTYQPKSESVRDIRFSPFHANRFAAAFENGIIQIWDIRKNTQPEFRFTAHKGLVLTLDWHPLNPHSLASGGRDRYVKIWDVLTDIKQPVQTIQTIASVGRVQWRPNSPDHIATSASLTDNSIHVWDVQRPCIPVASMKGHTDIASGILWLDTPMSPSYGHESSTSDWEGHDFWQHMLACSKDGTLRLHSLADAFKPHQSLPTIALALNSKGQIAFSNDRIDRSCASLKIHRYLNASSPLFTVADAVDPHSVLDSPVSSSPEINSRASDGSVHQGNANLMTGSATLPSATGVTPPPASSTSTSGNFFAFPPKISTASLSSSATPPAPLKPTYVMNPNILSSPLPQIPASNSGTVSGASMLSGSAGASSSMSGSHAPGIVRNSSSFGNAATFLKNAAYTSPSPRHHSQFATSGYSSGMGNSGLGIASGAAGSEPNRRSTLAISTRHGSMEMAHEASGFDGFVGIPRALVTLISMQNTLSLDEMHALFEGDASKVNEISAEGDPTTQDGESCRSNERFLVESFGFDEQVFRFLATHYLLCGENKTFHQMCRQNALAAMVAKQVQLCQMWRILELLYAKETFVYPEKPTTTTLSVSADNKLSSLAPKSTNAHASASSTSMTQSSSLTKTTSSLALHFDGKRAAKGTVVDDQDPVLDQASTADAIGTRENQNQTSMLLEQLDHVNPQAMQGFDPYPSYDANNSMLNGVGNGMELGGAGSRNRNQVDGLPHSLVINTTASATQDTLMNQRSSFVDANAVHGELSYLRDSMLKELLEYYVELGDIQTCVAIAVVLMKVCNVEKIIGKAWLQQMYMHYIDLLHQMQLFSIANELIANCSDTSIRQMNMKSTTVYSNCSRCSKPLDTFSQDVAVANASVCSTCNTIASRCSLCELPVRGLFVWCPVCSHGGHVEHLREWFLREDVCPTGCGHHCSINLQLE